jgi:hypothetical protein
MQDERVYASGEARRPCRNASLVHNMTLRINDPNIEAKFKEMRLERFNSFFYPSLVICVVVGVSLLIFDVANNTKNTHAFGWLLPEIISLFYWGCCRKYKPTFAMYFIFVEMFLRQLLNLLIIWDVFEEPAFRKDPSIINFSMTSSFIFFLVLNYTTFQETLYVSPFCVVIMMTLTQIGITRHVKYDQYDGSEVEQSQTQLFALSFGYYL